MIGLCLLGVERIVQARFLGNTRSEISRPSQILKARMRDHDWDFRGSKGFERTFVQLLRDLPKSNLSN